MHDEQNDVDLDTALTALARPEPPADHVARVLARTGIKDDGGASAGPDVASAPAYRRPAWLVPALAASVLVVVTAAWQVDRAARPDVDEALQAMASTSPTATAAEPDLNLPVLPPQAYWAMDAFTEFASLRPGARSTEDSQSRSTPLTRGSGVDRRAGSLVAAQPSGLPPIELEDISPAPVGLSPLDSLEDIAFAELPLTPIVMTPITEQEKP